MIFSKTGDKSDAGNTGGIIFQAAVAPWVFDCYPFIFPQDLAIFMAAMRGIKSGIGARPAHQRMPVTG